MHIIPDGARVIFTGDSITAQTNYTARIVDYYRRCLPEHNIKFYEAAIPGSTLPCAINFFDDLILPFSPTHATVFFGINDCGRGWLNGDGENPVARDFSTQFVVLKPQEATLFYNIRRFNGDI